jgi:hypothetical protein
MRSESEVYPRIGFWPHDCTHAGRLQCGVAHRFGLRDGFPAARARLRPGDASLRLGHRKRRQSVRLGQSVRATFKLTRPGGEIQSLDSADYGYVTINQAVTLLGAHGATGGPASNVSGVTTNAGANDVVTPKGLEIDGSGSEANGFQFTSGAALNVGAPFTNLNQALDLRRPKQGKQKRPRPIYSHSSQPSE